MAKIHLVQSQTPLTEGRDQDAMCGRTVKNAVIGAMIDSESYGGFLHGGFCYKCACAEWTMRYVYAVREGQIEQESNQA